MRNRLVLLGVAAVAVFLVNTAAFAQNHGVTFTPIGFIQDPGPFPASSVWAMNPQGTVFSVSPTFWGMYCFTWTREHGWETEIGQSGSECQISSNGTIMGEGLVPGSDPAYLSASTWAGAPNSWNPLPLPNDYEPCGDPSLSFFDMGGNGDFATGLTWSSGCRAGAFRWDKATNTTVNLGAPNGGQGRGNGISDDGRTVVGWGQMLFGNWRGARWDNGVWSWVDGQGNIEPMVCNVTGKPCTSNDGDPVYGCPVEYVDDSHCALANCVSGVCDGGANAGQACAEGNWWECPGYCVGGPNAGGDCNDDYYCPDTPVCVANPAWSDAAFKGEARDISASGHLVGVNFSGDYTTSQYYSAYRQNPDHSFTEIPTAPSFPDMWQPFRVSADGKTAVGMIGSRWWGSIAAFWNEEMGTQDLQLFLIQQGMDDLWFWNLTQLNAVSADGTVLAGLGWNPDGWQEGFVVDMKKLWICHAPPGQPEKARTLGIDIANVGSHLRHGDSLGTCEYRTPAGLARLTQLREQLKKNHSASSNKRIVGGRPDSSPFFPHPASKDQTSGDQRSGVTPGLSQTSDGSR